ncbi:hypothetical protein AMQ84_29845 [Paenibacillus riograndensis]|uniref:Adenosine deaminase domain-containing protein n=1 Tax=Paenibacillus riograndensis TaxID=483937 RepID=A0A132TG05_9BACL|nr:hypothetical protein [Paenibacillus riograndensis]KWX70275.1 hypothetical protein AMQ84_29845 [Paenibacillus riograndensis]
MISKINLIINISLFPIQNLKFYGQQDLVQALDYTGSGSLAKKKRENAYRSILSKLYAETLSKAQPNSLDEINLMMQKFYPMLCSEKDAESCGFKSPGSEETRIYFIEKMLYQHYFQILEEFSGALLSYRDGDIIFKYWKNDANKDKQWKFIDFMEKFKGQDKVLFFHAISRFIPVDLLIAVHHSKNNIHDPIQLHEFYQHINLADAPLDDILARGVAENHVHASAAFNFSILWQRLMNGLYPSEYFKKFTTTHFAVSPQVQEYIWTARLLRLVMSQYLKDTYAGYSQSIYEWIKDNFEGEPETCSLLLNLYKNEDCQFTRVDQLQEAIERVEIAFFGGSKEKHPDFIEWIFPQYQYIKTYGENIFLHQVMAYKRKLEDQVGSSGHYEQFFRLFFMYISIKNEFYQQVTQPTVLHGLDFFRGYFGRATDGIKADQAYFTIMLRSLFQNRYLQKIELRISIMDSETKNRKKLLHILESYRQILVEDFKVKDDPNSEFPLLGIVYHLIKRPDNVDKDSLLFDEARDHTLKKLYFGEHQETYIKQVQILQQLRKNVPMATNFIVGLDAASVENYTPVQVFAPVFEEARDSRYDSLRIVDPEGNVLPRQSLFFTFHAGEEFRHLNSGLRRMDEVMDYCKLHAGDRIGHGIALGVDIEEWVRRNPIVLMPRGEYLDNLLWVWGVYSRTTQMRTETLVYLERQIDEMADCIFNGNVSAGVPRAPSLFKTYKRRFKRIKDEVQRAKCNEHDSENQLFLCYHQESTLTKMNEPIYVDMNAIEKMMIKDMQDYLIRRISSSGIVIEVNPSSNEAIGEIDSLFGNQLFKIQSAENGDLSNIIVNINSDDPMVFNTNVSNELVYMYYGMLQQGIGREAALNWIEKLRRSGMETSFIRGTRSRAQYLRILNMTIQALKDPYYS